MEQHLHPLPLISPWRYVRKRSGIPRLKEESLKINRAQKSFQSTAEHSLAPNQTTSTTDFPSLLGQLSLCQTVDQRVFVFFCNGAWVVVLSKIVYSFLTLPLFFTVCLIRNWFLFVRVNKLILSYLKIDSLRGCRNRSWYVYTPSHLSNDLFLCDITVTLIPTPSTSCAEPFQHQLVLCC